MTATVQPGSFSHPTTTNDHFRPPTVNPDRTLALQLARPVTCTACTGTPTTRTRFVLIISSLSTSSVQLVEAGGAAVTHKYGAAEGPCMTFLCLASSYSFTIRQGANFECEDGGETLVVHGGQGSLSVPPKGKEIYLGNAGTAARFLTTVCTLVQPSETGPATTIITGNARMKQRPIGPLVDALRTNGSGINYLESQGFLPLSIAIFDEQISSLHTPRKLPPFDPQRQLFGASKTTRSAYQELLFSVIVGSIFVKAHIVTNDERETTGLRNLVNFGHTIGHAIEAVLRPSILHGECVSIGMILKAEVARQLGHLGQVGVGRLTRCLKSYNLPVSLSDPRITAHPASRHHSVDRLLDIMRIRG